jgi:hypothetical protein
VLDDPSGTVKKEPAAGRAFLGGADKYTEEELAIAKAAIEAYRKGKRAAKQDK